MIILTDLALNTLKEGKVQVDGGRQKYNRFRPHSSLGYKPPAPETKWLEKLNQGAAH